MKKIFRNFSSSIIILILLLSACSSNPEQVVVTQIVNTPINQGAAEENAFDSTPEPIDTSQPENLINLDEGPITIYHIGDLTSRFAPYNAPAIRGLEDWAQVINNEDGILGHELVLDYSENGGDVKETISAFEKIVENDNNPLMVVVYQTEHAEAILPIARKNEIPVINLGIMPVQPEFQTEDFLFNFYVPYDEQLSFFLEFLVDNWAEINPVTLDTGIRLAYFAWEDFFGQSALTAGNRELLESLGIQLVAEEYYLPSSVENISNAVVGAWYAGANVIYTNTYMHGPALILNNLNRLVLRDFFVVGGPSPTLDITSYSYLEYNSYLEGFYAPSPYPWYSDENNIAIHLLKDNLENSDRTIADNSQKRILAQGVLELLVFTIEEALLESEGGKINGNSIYAILENLEGYQVMDSLFEIDFTDGNRTLNVMQMRQVRDFLGFELLE
ncbi:MAG: ABC transporter substrate-binding protein [Chloroflexi bacterium]|nr:ABC transporter substrate-binding protein [Chloroflexota bacterium]